MSTACCQPELIKAGSGTSKTVSKPQDRALCKETPGELDETDNGECKCALDGGLNGLNIHPLDKR
jgi:hypothetical protein